MLFLWMVGREMESMYGSRDFVAMYLGAAIFSTFCWALADYYQHGGDSVPMVGASGAVLAVVVLYTMYYPRREVLLFFVLPVEMWLLLVVYLFIQAWQFLQGGDTSEGGRGAPVGGRLRLSLQDLRPPLVPPLVEAGPEAPAPRRLARAAREERLAPGGPDLVARTGHRQQALDDRRPPRGTARRAAR